MAKLRVGNRTPKGVFKNVVLDIGRQVKIGIGYVDGKPVEQRILATLEMLESSIISGQEPSIELWRRIRKLPSGIQKKLVSKKLIILKDDGPTLEQLVDEFIADKLPTTDPRTVRNYKSTLENGLLTFLDRDRQVDTVESDDLIDFINSSSKNYSDSTVANQIKRAKAAFQLAMDQGYKTENPFKSKKLRELCSQFTIKLASDRVQTQTEFMTADELKRLLQCKKSERSDIEDKEWNALVWLLRYGACRVSSYLILRWKDIDFETGTIRIRMKRTGIKRKFKVGDKRIEIVPLWDELVVPLQALKKLQPEGTEYVLNKIGKLEQKPEFEQTNSKGERVKQGRWETNLSTTFKKILKRNGFQIWDQPFHAFRSYRAAELDRNGASEIELNAWIGNSEAVRKRHYGKFHVATKERLAELSRKSA